MIIKANDPLRRSWLEVPAGSDFPIQNLPFGIFSTHGDHRRAGTIIGDTVVDLEALAALGYFQDILPARVFSKCTLNDFISLGRPVWRKVRGRLAQLFDESNPELRDHVHHRAGVLFPTSSVAMHLPVEIGDYTDFYSSKEHATNVGTMFRDPANALLPNWKHIPVGYHGRSSSIVVSGTDIHRPKGQTLPAGAETPVFGPSRQFDFELEMAFISGRTTELGESIPVSEAEEAIFGMVIFNDLSARDIQKWEYVPLGPFLSKNFGSVVSPWIVTLDALEPLRVAGPEQDVQVLDYLRSDGERAFDIRLEVGIRPGDGEEKTVCRSNFRHLYWNMAQQLAHQTVNGCNIRVGDMYASGTISGPTPDSFGSMLELAWKGTRPIDFGNGTTRSFIEDGDTIVMRGWGESPEGIRIGFGESRTTILPATT